MRSLLLIKHSLPEIQENAPARDWHLSEEGRRRCHSLAKAITPYSPELFISSTEPKAMETASLTANDLGLQAVTADNLHEHVRPDGIFLSKHEFQLKVAAFFARPQELVFGRETADQAHARFRSALDQALLAHADKNIAVVAHGTVITLFVSRLSGQDPLHLWQRLDLPSVVILSLPERRLVSILETVSEAST